MTIKSYRFAEIVKVMVALSILFTYGLQFCVPSEIVWSHLEPWLRQRRAKNAKRQNSNVDAVNILAGSSMNSTHSSTETISEERLLEKLRSEEPMTGAYYTMRALMILGTGRVIFFFYFVFLVSITICKLCIFYV